MFRASQWQGGQIQQQEQSVPLPFGLYGALEAEMIEKMRRRVIPLEDYLIYRVEKQNILESL